MSEWQPIETAPKDGRTILGIGPYCLEPITVQWRQVRQTKGWFPTHEGSRVIAYMSDFGTEYVDDEPLTHWLPIPETPK